MGFVCGPCVCLSCEFFSPRRWWREGGWGSLWEATGCVPPGCKMAKRHDIQMEHVFLDCRLLGQLIKLGLYKSVCQGSFPALDPSPAVVWSVFFEGLPIKVCGGLGQYGHKLISRRGKKKYLCFPCNLPGLLLTFTGSQCKQLCHLWDIVLFFVSIFYSYCFLEQCPGVAEVLSTPVPF